MVGLLVLGGGEGTEGQKVGNCLKRGFVGSGVRGRVCEFGD